MFGEGAIAQLVERLLCKQDVVGSNPSGSTRPQSMADLKRPVERAAPLGRVQDICLRCKQDCLAMRVTSGRTVLGALHLVKL